MSKTYSGHGSLTTPQSEPIPGKDMIENNAGGFSFPVDKWAQFERFLVLGSEGGTYYVGEHKMTAACAENARACISENGQRAVELIRDVSVGGRAHKNDQAIFALALAASVEDEETRALALSNLRNVCRIPTHLFMFNALVEENRGRGRALNRAVGQWYTEADPMQLAYHMAKYQQRDGWSNRDLLRLTHPTPKNPEQNELFKWIVGKGDAPAGPPRAMKELEGCDEHHAINLITEFKMTHEMVPSEFKKSPKVWAALLPHMPLGALIRNLGRLTANGLIKPLSDDTKLVCDKLTNATALKKARVHPMAVLNALAVYRSGHGVRGTLNWKANGAVVDALDDAFYMSFDNVEPTGKNLLLSIDISGSMGSPISGGMISCREAAACMAMVTARVEKNYAVGVFATEYQLTDISSKARLAEVTDKLRSFRMGGTDCAEPMAYAGRKNLDVDAFAIYTDNETWAGGGFSGYAYMEAGHNGHPAQALQAYRKLKNDKSIPLVVAAMTTTNHSIADPNDARMLDVIGFDTSAPAAISDFIRGEV